MPWSRQHESIESTGGSWLDPNCKPRIKTCLRVSLPFQLLFSDSVRQLRKKAFGRQSGPLLRKQQEIPHPATR